MSNTISQPPKNCQKVLCRITFFFCLITVLGCRKQVESVLPSSLLNNTDTEIRVLMLKNATTLNLRIQSSFSIITQTTQLQSARFKKFNETINVTVSDGKIFIGGWTSKQSNITIVPDSPHTFSLNGDHYRGNLQLILNSDANSFDAVNLVCLESYLAGVVGAEMQSYWEPAALQAQSIAARTYCLYTKKRFGTKRHWDVKKTQAHQVYRGLASESNKVQQAINSTANKILVCRQPDDDTEDIFPAYYSSVCGGHTENSTHVFGGKSFNSLIGAPCPYCVDIAPKRFISWPAVEFTKTYITKRLTKRYPSLKKIGQITNISAVKESRYGQFSRLTKIKITGSAGKFDFLRAEDFRLAIDPSGAKLKSAALKIVDKQEKWRFINGRGYGHAVGMCQCGAEGMARQGKTAEQILSHYYPHSKIRNIKEK